MTKDKNPLPTRLLWMDLEMTGLDPQKDVLLEVAIEVTDFKLKTLASYECRIKQKRDVVVERMQKNTWWRDFPENRDEFVNNVQSGLALAEVEQNLINLVEQHFGDEPAILAGNSIHNDRNFIKRWMPSLDLKLHYRMLDVTSWKVFMQGHFGEDFQKQNSHRAFDDIQASIAELQFYLDWFKKHQ